MANEEEYHIPDQEFPPAEEALAQMTQPPKTGSGFLKKILFFALVVVAIWGVHRVFTVFMHGKNKTENITGLTSPVAPLTPPEKMSSVTKPPQQMQQQQGMNNVSSGLSPTVEKRVSSMEETNAELQAQIERMNANVADMQSTLASLASQIAAVNNAVQDLAGQVAQQQTRMQLETVVQHEKKARRASSGGGKSTAARQKTKYYLQAMVPGRAWLVSSRGAMTTVKVGDAVPGYGEVVSIDPNLSAVTTSTGDVITLNDDE